MSDRPTNKLMVAIVTIGIIVLLGALVTCITMSVFGTYFAQSATTQQLLEAKNKTTQLRMQVVDNSISTYYAINAKLPGDLDGLSNPPAGAPFVRTEDTRDAWGRSLVYKPTSRGAWSLRSAGPDGVEGNTDDLVSTRGTDAP